MTTDYYDALGVECIDIIDALHASFRIGSILKYIYRAGYKSAETVSVDFAKAMDYALDLSNDDITADAIDAIEAAALITRLKGISDLRRRALLLTCLCACGVSSDDAREELIEILEDLI